MKIEKILFPTDFSRYSQKARDYAVYLGGSLGASVHILHAIEPIDYEDYDEEVAKFYQLLEDEIKEKLSEEVMYFENEKIKVHSSMVIGKRWKTINTYAKEKDIDLIVMGSHGIKREDGDISVGTTSHKVMFSSPCPVLIVRE